MRSIIEYVPKNESRDFKIRKKKRKRFSTGKSSSETGYIPSMKNNEYCKGMIWEYESLLEHDGYLLIDHAPSCLDLQPQFLEIYVEWSTSPIVLDCWAIYKNGEEHVYDFKLSHALKGLEEDENWLKRKAVILQICKDKGWIYQEVDETVIRTTRLENIKLMLKSVKGINLLEENLISNDNKSVQYYLLMKKFDELLRESILENEQILGILELTDILTEKTQLPSEWIISMIHYKLYYFQGIYIDWDVPLVENSIKLDYIPLKPLHKILKEKPSVESHYIKQRKIIDAENPVAYNFKEIELRLQPLISKYLELTSKDTESNSDESFNKRYLKLIRDFSKKVDRKFDVVYEEFKIWKNYHKEKERQAYYLPIKTRFSLNGKKSDVIEFCLEELGWDQNKSNKAYYYYKKHKDEFFKGSKSTKVYGSKFSDEVENLIIDYIDSWDRDGGSVQKSQLISNMRNELFSLGYIENEIPSERTLRRRIKDFNNSPTKAKAKSRRAKSITKSLIGYNYHGMYPGAVIHGDHTQLDIWVLDGLTLLPIARPWLSVFMDENSGSIWGMSLSLYEPDGERVVETIVNGLTNKTQTREWTIVENLLTDIDEDKSNFQWPVSGMISKINFDNGLDFHSRQVKELCSKLNITLSYRATYTPEWAGRLEQFWNIVNSSIRNRKLSGRVFPIDKKRRRIRTRTQFTPPEGYDAKKDSGLTLFEFEQYLYSHLLIEYQNKPHGGDSYSPNQIWTDGLSGLNFQAFSGHPLKFNFEDNRRYSNFGLKKKSASLNNRGIRFDNLQYSSNWINQARTRNQVKDGEYYWFYYSNWDAKYIWLIDRNQDLHTLEAKNYYKSKNIRRLLFSVFKNDIPIDRKSIKYIENLVGEDKNTQIDTIEKLMRKILSKLEDGKKLNKKDQRLIERFQNGLIEETMDSSLTDLFIERLKNQASLHIQLMGSDANSENTEIKSDLSEDQGEITEEIIFGSWEEMTTNKYIDESLLSKTKSRTKSSDFDRIMDEIRDDG